MTGFPNGFFWGSATSSHQVEGDNRLNNWWRCEEAGRVKERSLKACDHYNLFEKDFDIAKSLNHNAHRFSIEWSRVEPREGEWDLKELEHYRAVIRALRKRGIEPMVTLHHFTLPVWVSDRGGFLSGDIIGLFERYSARAVEELGSDVHYWMTINEPHVLALMSYFEGKWPPFERSFFKSLAAIRIMLLAHARAYHAIHGVYGRKGWPRPEVSMAKNTFSFRPCRKANPFDRMTVRARKNFFNDMYFDAARTGWLFFPGIYCEYHPEIKGTLDFLGINYYTRQFIRAKGLGVPNIFGSVCGAPDEYKPIKTNSLGWEVYAEGLREVLDSLKKYDLPVIITENGICARRDEERWDFIKSHVTALAESIDKGVKVKGYLYWSLLDNFEWADGYGPRFGLVEVDYGTQERRVRESARKYAEICGANKI